MSEIEAGQLPVGPVRPQTDPNFAKDLESIPLRPYLTCSSDYAKTYQIRGPFGRLITMTRLTVIAPHAPWSSVITVRNKGSYPAYACHVQVREFPGCVLKAQTMFGLTPGGSKDVTLEIVTGEPGTTLMGLCFDPILDADPIESPLARHTTLLTLVTQFTIVPRLRLGTAETVSRSMLGLRRRGG